MLAADCAAVPPQWLEIAAKEWIQEGDGFLPTASALIRLARDALGRSTVVPVEYEPGKDGPAYTDRLRLQREHTAILKRLWNREIPERNLSAIPELTFRSAIAEGSCMTMRDGSRRYRTKETIDEFERSRPSA